jgi:hypothetical protein
MTARPFHPKKDEAAQEEFKKNFRVSAQPGLSRISPGRLPSV